MQGGSTAAFFEQSKFPTYKRMWQFMSSQKGLLMNSTEEAIRRVKREEYAYILESTMNEYYTQRDCELMQVGGLLDSKGYGIGLPEGSKYREPISETILKLQNNQIIDKLRFRWWREMDINVSCDAKQTKKSDTSSLGVEKVGGCFVMLLIGMAVSIIVSLFEFVYSSYHRMSVHKRTLREEMARDFRFSMACSSFRSQMAEEAMQMPPPPSMKCFGSSSDTKSSFSAAMAYAPCLPAPDVPINSNVPVDLLQAPSRELNGNFTSKHNVPSNGSLTKLRPETVVPPEDFHLKSVGRYDLPEQRLSGDAHRTSPMQHSANQQPSRYVTEVPREYARPGASHPVVWNTNGSTEGDEEDEEEELEGEQWLADPSPDFPDSPTDMPLRGPVGIMPIRNMAGSYHEPQETQMKKVSC